MVAAVVAAAAGVSGTGVVDISRCRNGCSAVPEDLWPSCCESHSTCCQEFANSCMHDCLPRVHTGDVSVVEERPGMCCALYNLCCFRETFRISSRDKPQQPVSFPIVHRFHVRPPTQQEASSIPSGKPPSRRPGSGFQTTQLGSDSQDGGALKTIKRPNPFSRPQLTKKQFRPQRPQGFKKPSTAADDEGDTDGGSKKPRDRPKLSSFFLANIKQSDDGPRLSKRPTTSDIRQVVAIAEAGEAQGRGYRRLDASINPMVSKKRLKVSSEVEQPARRDRKPQSSGDGPTGRKFEGAPVRGSRPQQGAERTTSQVSPKTPGRSQPERIVAGQEAPRPLSSQVKVSIPTGQDETRKTTIEKSGPPQTTKDQTESQKETETPTLVKGASDQTQVVVKADQAQDTSKVSAPAGIEKSLEGGEAAANQASETDQPDGDMTKAANPSAASGDEPATQKVSEASTDQLQTSAKSSSAPAEVVKTPAEPQQSPRIQISPEPTKETRDSPRSRGTTQNTRAQAGNTDAQGQARSRSGEGSRGRESSNPSRRGSQSAEASRTQGREQTNAARQSRARDQSSTRTRSQATDQSEARSTSRARG